MQGSIYRPGRALVPLESSDECSSANWNFGASKTTLHDSNSSLCDGAGVNDCTHHFQLLVRWYLYTKFIWNSQIKKGKVSSAYLVTFDLSIRRSDPN